MDNVVFLDTAYAIALSIEHDQYHRQAVELTEEIEKEETRLITTEVVVIEICNFLAKVSYRSTAVAFVKALQRDETVTVVPVSPDLFGEGFALYEERSDKEWSLTHCLSFIVMKRQGLRTALTTDRHFEQAGFSVLLR